MVAALLLDREARSVVLDADPAYGSLMEPFLRLVRLMKSLEFRPKADRKYVDLVKSLIELIGQEPHALPDVFSFFLPEFQPKGEIHVDLQIHLAARLVDANPFVLQDLLQTVG